MTLDNWVECGRRLGAVGRGVGWWIGDWLIYGNERYGEKYVRASRITGYDTQTLMNMAYVASRFDYLRRREPLSWSHHAEVAALEIDDQERWLTFAIDHRLSVRSLRQEVKAAHRARQKITSSKAPSDRSHRSDERDFDGTIRCPHCRQAFDASALESTEAPSASKAETPGNEAHER